MLEFLNSILIFIIVVVTVVNTVLIVKARQKLEKTSDLDRQVKSEIANMKLEVNNMVRTYLSQTTSLVDLAEFKNLNEETKKHYRFFITEKIMPLVMVELNRRIKDVGMNEYLTMYKKDIATLIDTELKAGLEINTPSSR
jgi:hypothetical protein